MFESYGISYKIPCHLESKITHESGLDAITSRFVARRNTTAEKSCNYYIGSETEDVI